MSFPEPHEIHKRRFSRNMALGLVLGGFVAIVFGLTFAKVSQNGFETPRGEQQQQQQVSE